MSKYLQNAPLRFLVSQSDFIVVVIHSVGCHGYPPHSLAAPSVCPGNFPTPIYWQWITLAITSNEPTLQLLL